MTRPAINSVFDGLVAYWPLQEVSGTRYDRVGTSHLTATSTIVYTHGKPRAAQLALASSDYFTVADNAALSMGDINFSVAAWISIPASFAGASRSPVSKSTATLLEYAILTGANVGEGFFFVVNNSLGTALTSVQATTPGAPNINQWYLVIGWHDADNDQIGIRVENNADFTTPFTAGTFDGTGALDIGRVYGAGAYIDMRVCHVMVWKNKILSDAEKLALWNYGTGLFPNL